MAENWHTCTAFESPRSSAWDALDLWVREHVRRPARWQAAEPISGVALSFDLDPDNRSALSPLAQIEGSEELAGRLLFFEAGDNPSESFDSLAPDAERPDWIASRIEPRSEALLLSRSGFLEIPGAGRWLLFRCRQRAASFRQALQRGAPRAPEGPLGGRSDWFRKRHGGGGEDLS